MRKANNVIGYKTKLCKWCKQPFEAPIIQCYFKGKKHGTKCRITYCSPECRGKGLAKAARKANHDDEKAQPNMQCAVCGTPIYKPPRWFRAGKKEAFCSRKCVGIRKREEMKGNTYGAGIKQTPERIAHRVSFMIGEKNPCWNGGISLHRSRSNSYKLIKCPPEFSNMSMKNGYVLEHRLIMAQYLGRCLTKKEVVHHINHDSLDNRIENLMLFSDNAEHKLHEGQTGYFKEYWRHIRTNRRNSEEPSHPKIQP